MSSPQESGDPQPGGSTSGGSRSFTPQTARYNDFQAAHRAITGQDTSGIADHEFLPDPSVFEDDSLSDKSTDTTAVEDGELPDPEWFDQAFLEDDDDDMPPSGEEIPVSASETSEDPHPPAQHALESARDESHDTVGHIYDQYINSEANETVHSASSYRAAPEEVRREGAAGRLGFHQQSESSSSSATLYDGQSVEEMAARVRALTDSSGPSLPLPNDPPEHPQHVDNVAFGDPSVSSVTNSQALLQGTLVSPPGHTDQHSHRAAHHHVPSVPPPVPRRSSRRIAPEDNSQRNAGRFPALFRNPTDTRRPIFETEETDCQALRSHVIEEEDEWGGPGPAVVRGVVVEEHSPLRRNPAIQSNISVPAQQASASASRTASGVQEPSTSSGRDPFNSSGVQESSTSSGRDPFHYERLFIAPEQERVVTSRLRIMTGESTVFSQSPLNSPERLDELTDVQLNEPREAVAGPPRDRPGTTSREGDQRLFLRMARQEDQSLALRRCHCRFPGYECKWCIEEDERARRRDNGPYAASPSYRMDKRGIRVADEHSHQPTFYIGASPENYSSTERIIAHPAEHAVTSPSPRPARALQRSDFSTFQPIQRTHRVNGRDLPLAPTRRPVQQPNPSEPTLLGLSGGNPSQYEFRDSTYGPPNQEPEAKNVQVARRSANWRSLTHPQDVASSSPVDQRATNRDIWAHETPYAINPESPTQFPFSLLPLDEARRRQADDRARGAIDQTFISTTGTASSRQVSVAGSSSHTVTAGGSFSAFLSQAHLPRMPGRRRAVTRTTGRGDSFSSVMRAALEDDIGQEQVPHAFLPGTTTAPSPFSNTRPAFLNPPPRIFPATSSSRYGNINDDDIEMVPYGAGTAGIATATSGGVLGRRWSA